MATVDHGACETAWDKREGRRSAPCSEISQRPPPERGWTSDDAELCFPDAAIDGPSNPGRSWEETNYEALNVPGATYRPIDGYATYVVELRGWLRSVGDSCEGGDHDWHYGLELDPSWLDHLGCSLNQIFTVGSVISMGNPRPQNDYPLVVAAVPRINVELTPWRIGRASGPPGWIHQEPSCPEVVWPYPPRNPLPWQEPLAEGQYVRMVGSLITDVPHDPPSKNPWRTGSDGGPARWTELHSVDIIEVLPYKEPDEWVMGIAVCAEHGWFSGNKQTLDLWLPYGELKPNWSDGSTNDPQELILSCHAVASPARGFPTRDAAPHTP
jgi:hypothetical protein